MTQCKRCGRINPDGIQICKECGSPLDGPVRPAPSNAGSRGTSAPKASGFQKNQAVAAWGFCIAMIILAVVVFSMIANDDEQNVPSDDNDPVISYNIQPLDGTFVLSGSATTSDKTATYSGTATFRFVNGNLVDRQIDVETINNPGSGIDLSRPTITPGGEHQSGCMHVYPVKGMDYHETMEYVNPFLRDLENHGDCRHVTIDGKTVSGCGFEDREGNTYFVSEDGRLVSFSYTKYPKTIYFNLS